MTQSFAAHAGELHLHPGERFLEALDVEGFQQVIQRVDLEGPEGVAIVSRHEDDRGHLDLRVGFLKRAKCLDYLEAAELRHLDVEKDEVVRAFREGSHR